MYYVCIILYDPLTFYNGKLVSFLVIPSYYTYFIQIFIEKFEKNIFISHIISNKYHHITLISYTCLQKRLR